VIYKKILLNQNVKRELPKNFSRGDLKLFEHELSKNLPDVFIIGEEDVTIHNHARVVSNKGKELIEFSAVFKKPGGWRGMLMKILTPFVARRRKFNGVYFWAIDEWSHGFFHWIMDALPRILCLHEYEPGAKLLLPEEYKGIDYVQDSLKIFDFDIVYYKAPIKVKKLITCTYLAPSGNYNTDVLMKLKNKYLEYYSSGQEIPFRNIYISRKKAFRRKLLNEDELINVLNEFNFEVVYLEDYNWEEKVKLMNSAKNVISIHGAGITNCLFMKEGSNLIELRKAGDYRNNAYFSLANALQLNYYYLPCTPLNEAGINYDLLVDKEGFRNMLENVIAYKEAQI
jgi:Capsular polysaccharide biosynthesis protein